MKNLSALLLSPFFLFLTGCSDEDNSNPTPNPTANTLTGVFLDSPVEGLSYSSGSLSGTTNNAGQFEYEENQTVSFSVGGVSIGTVAGKETITPLDLVSGGNVNDPTVRNIAAFLQSLDDDGNASNGITISAATSQALASATIDFSSVDFYSDLVSLVQNINTSNSSSLTVVSANDAASHLAGSLGIQEEFEYLPHVIQGRAWEEGEYFPYNTTRQDSLDDSYVFRIGNSLEGVRYHFGNNAGFYMNMNYSGDSLYGYGNYYLDLDATPPVEKADPNYEYRNRVTSPGVVFEYGDSTYIGYYNFYKKEGEQGRLQGVYEQFQFYDQKLSSEQNPEKLQSFHREMVISGPDANGDFAVLIKQYNRDGSVTEESRLFDKQNIDNRNIALIRFQNTDYIFINRNLANQEAIYYHPGLFSVRR